MKENDPKRRPRSGNRPPTPPSEPIFDIEYPVSRSSPNEAFLAFAWLITGLSGAASVLIALLGSPSIEGYLLNLVAIGFTLCGLLLVLIIRLW